MVEKRHEDAIIGANLKKFRSVYGISRKELAEIFHISEDGVYRIERGETGLSSSYAYILAKDLHCDMNFIFGNAREPARITEDGAYIRQMTPKNIAQRLRYYAEMIEEMSKGER